MKTFVAIALLTAACAPHHALAYSVFCNFASPPHGGAFTEGVMYVTTDTVEYRVDVGQGETLLEFLVGYGVSPLANSTYALDSNLNPLAWTDVLTYHIEEGDTYSPDLIQSTPPDFALSSLRYLGAPLPQGTYYFGYRVPLDIYQLIDTGWECMDLAGSLDANEIWVVPVSSGLGPVHTLGPVPEPATLTLVGLGSLLMLWRRRATRSPITDH